MAIQSESVNGRERGGKKKEERGNSWWVWAGAVEVELRGKEAYPQPMGEHEPVHFVLFASTTIGTVFILLLCTLFLPFLLYFFYSHSTIATATPSSTASHPSPSPSFFFLSQPPNHSSLLVTAQMGVILHIIVVGLYVPLFSAFPRLIPTLLLAQFASSMPCRIHTSFTVLTFVPCPSNVL